MKLSLIFELLLIFVLIAFAASAAVKESPIYRRMARKSSVKKHGKVTQKRQDTATNTANRFCSCSMNVCNCCRNFNIPIIPLKGPGCAALQYLKGDKLAISMSFGDIVLTNTTISGNRPLPVCMPLPGGVSKFCGRIYNIGRQDNEFNACLGLELRALDEVEAAVRVSCFRFSSKGLRLAPPQPLPVLEESEDDDDDDDEDDDDDDFDYDDTDSDYSSFNVLDDDFMGDYFQGDSGSSSSSNKKKVTTAAKVPVKKATRKPVVKPIKAVQKPARGKVTPKPVKMVIKTSSTTTMPVTTVTVVSENDVNTRIGTNSTNETQSNPEETMVSTTESVVETESTQTEMSSDTTTVPEVSTTTPKTKDKDEDDDDDDDSEESSEEDEDDDDEEDPIADAVGDALDDGSSEKSKKSEKQTTKTPNKQEESKEFLDDVVDGVIDTIAGEDSDESRSLNKQVKVATRGRQSRDMRIDGQHW